ncbi:MAG: amidoligase family protein, partial [Oscillospiraceae bacterium]|nr:amidoligase family protein [Oscillospiraceae bacterium]
LYRSLGVKPRRTSYCKKLEDEFVDRLNSNKPKTMDSFANDVYKNHGGTSEMRHHYSSARYYGINFHAYFTKKTVEFRLFNSTLHAGWVRTYVILAIAMNNQALNQRFASSKITTSTNPCFTFRTWLLRMGFIGDLYETPRKLLLENLEGNKAWRYGIPAAVNQ